MQNNVDNIGIAI